MANREQLSLLKRGVTEWNEWRKQFPEVQPDLSGAILREFPLTRVDLRRADLRGVNLLHADLTGADLREANLSKAILAFAILGGTDLRGANLSEADLEEADFFESLTDVFKYNDAMDPRNHPLHLIWRKSNLIQANFSKANLVRANLWWTDLSGADLREADLSEARLNGVDLSDADLNGANLSGAVLNRARLVRTDLTDANLTNCSVYGISVWDVCLEGARQDNLIITPDDEPTITVDDLEVAQFIYLLLNHQKLRNVLNAVTQRGVLLLGRFGGGGLEVLQALAARLKEDRYLPIIFDFARPDDRNYSETVKTLAGLSRFIIADLSGPSVPQELYATVPHFKIPFVPILEAGRKSFAMAVDLLEYPWVVRPPVIFNGIDDLIGQVQSNIIGPAEEKYQARKQLLDELFHEA